MRKIVLFLSSIIFLFPFAINAQGDRTLGPYKMIEQIIYQKKQSSILSFISNDCARGRSTGTIANQMVGKYIRDHFESYGLEPFFDGYYYQRFHCDSVIKGANIVGMIRSIIPSNKYVIISAHYDHIGAINGFVYNGADDNGSGVTSLLNLAEIFGTMKKAKLGPDKNIIFAAFDAKELSMKGSKYFVNNLKIDKKQIECAINIDQIGSILEPVHKGDTNYVIVLGEKTLKKENIGKLRICNTFYNLNLDIDYTFYGSDTFTNLYYKLSDQSPFIEAKIPALLFTSGFNKHTYKISDDENIISYPTLKKRTLLIFYFITMI